MYLLLYEVILVTMTLEKHRPSDHLCYREEHMGNAFCTMEKDISGDSAPAAPTERLLKGTGTQQHAARSVAGNTSLSV